MKTLLLTTALILTCQILTCQKLQHNFNYHYKKTPESVKIVTVIVGSIALEAIADACYDNGNKFAGHALQATSTGLLLASPFLLDIDRGKCGWYFLSYLTFRIALFDPIYNLSRGLPVGYIGSTSAWDRGLNVFDCSTVSDGASAIAIMSEEGLAKTGVSKSDAVEVIGFSLKVNNRSSVDASIINPKLMVLLASVGEKSVLTKVWK